MFFTLFFWLYHNFLFFILLVLLIGIFLFLFIPSSSLNFLKIYSLVLTLIIFFLSLFLWLWFNNSNFIYLFQFVTDFLWSENYSIYYSIGIDGFSLFFIILTTFLFPFCILLSWNAIYYRVKEFLLCLLIIEFLLINVFISLNLFFFYIFFESVLIPMFFLIGIWGSRQRKVHAVFLFFFYTLVGSILMLIGILFIFSQVNTTDIRFLITLDIELNRQLILWLSFFIAFAIKVPMIPFHIWLPEAHVEAPTAGSVILAGLLLKLGTYGLLRFVIILFPEASFFFTPLVFTMSVLAIIYISCTTIRQVDLKKIIAYSSVAHMNFVTIGLFSLNLQGLAGSIFLMLSHGLVSSALFICIGFLYDRYKTRLLVYYGGLVHTMPFFTLFFFLLTLANVSFPGSSSFVGELLIILGILDHNFFVTFFATFGIILGAVYSFWLFNRLCFQTIQVNYLKNFNDLSLREFFILSIFAILILIFGIYPDLILRYLELPLYNFFSLRFFHYNLIFYL